MTKDGKPQSQPGTSPPRKRPVPAETVIKHGDGRYQKGRPRTSDPTPPHKDGPKPTRKK